MNKAWIALAGANFYTFNCYHVFDKFNTTLYVKNNHVVVVHELSEYNFDKTQSREKVMASFNMPKYLIAQMLKDLKNFQNYTLDHFKTLETFENVEKGLTMRVHGILKSTTALLAKEDISFELTSFMPFKSEKIQNPIANYSLN